MDKINEDLCSEQLAGKCSEYKAKTSGKKCNIVTEDDMEKCWFMDISWWNSLWRTIKR